MSKPRHLHLSDARGLHRLASDATVGVTDLVEAVHRTVLRTPGTPGPPPAGRTRGITGFVYKTVRGVTRLVGGGVDTLLGVIAPLVSERPSSPQREAVLAALNGVFGDYLDESANPLAIPMTFRIGGAPLALTGAALAAAFPAPSRRVLVLVHGLCLNDLQWNRDGHDHGAALARDPGFAPVYLHYNSGRHISTNGREFADMMEALVRAWPHPVERIAIVGHSMGGLVARSGCHYAALAGHSWLTRLDDLVFLGTPHFGAPLERAGAWVDYLVGISPYTAPFARLGKARSAGIKDLRHGDLRDQDWQKPASRGARPANMPVRLPAGVRCFAIAGSRQEKPGASASRTRGDGLVPVDSALGRQRNRADGLGLPDANCRILYGTGHFDLLDRAAAYEAMKCWLSPTGVRTTSSPAP
jgi:pimeloyl-ACP methyl ester carboxylesterase